ncbi:TIGR01777 family protein [Halobacteriovorax sp. BALOs_7]|uniref:TIGR01777 family oxidoreductase n=1 Tax=unclassified Halobacteriovorax TaxID=2639665 RepID=UPI000EA1CD57|nr:TIGR01777 family oxidoreductase [Halobacteriovorax sp. BALOs_7]AYF45168.1 TIGR01777 family protein [Halobacteriovorax sp. BALOs_7]
MSILITGATGLIGQELVYALAKAGHEDIRVLTRNTAKAAKQFTIPLSFFEWDPNANKIDESALEGVETIIHLAGENIGGGRWSEKQKEKILNSRTQSTKLLVDTINNNQVSLKKFITASAIGIYGTQSEKNPPALKEDASYGDDFLAKVCKAWEDETDKLNNKEILINHVRTGIVLANNGGALQKMLPAFKLGVAGKLGSGNQFMSWIHIKDLVSIYLHLVENQVNQVAINATAPRPVSNKEFTSTLGSVVKRPTILPAPGFALKIILGEMSTLLLDGQNVIPSYLNENKFQFQFPNLKDALEDLVGLEKKFSQVQWVERPVENVFNFFSNEKNLETITPDSIGFKVLDMNTPEITKGTIIDYRLSIYGIPLKWKSEILHFVKGKEFVDKQLEGPYNKWVHTHGFIPYKNGTLLTDEVLYKVPLGALGDLFAGAFVRSDVKKIFKFRSQKLDKIFDEVNK